jgi:putative flippase GtrA
MTAVAAPTSVARRPAPDPTARRSASDPTARQPAAISGARRVAPPPAAGRGHSAKLVRYAASSLICTAISLATLGVLVGVVNTRASLANLVACAVSTVPSFELNRRWVWAKRGGPAFTTEVVPFWIMAFLGLALSTVLVHLASGATAGWSRSGHTVAVEGANVAGYGSLWLAEYLVLDRLMFRTQRQPVPAPA